MIGGKSAVDGDVLPFGLVMGNRARLAGLNLVGLRRSRVSREDIKTMLRIYRYLFNSIPSGFAPALDLEYHENVVARAEQVQNYLDNHVKMTQQEINPMITEMVHFVIDSRKRVRSSLCTPLENK
jgi:acyl-[acyl carrier protein]--UDP-N-acetylglucosamine O-acyltransferase